MPREPLGKPAALALTARRRRGLHGVSGFAARNRRRRIGFRTRRSRRRAGVRVRAYALAAAGIGSRSEATAPSSAVCAGFRRVGVGLPRL